MKDTKLQYYIDTQIDVWHDWFDGWQYWPLLVKAMAECDDLLWKSHVMFYSKEKFGSYVCDVKLWDGSWTLRSRGDKPNREWWCAILNITHIVDLVQRVQMWYINRGIQRICKKYPEVLNELLNETSYCRQIHGDIDGKKIFNKYWYSANA